MVIRIKRRQGISNREILCRERNYRGFWNAKVQAAGIIALGELEGCRVLSTPKELDGVAKAILAKAVTARQWGIALYYGHACGLYNSSKVMTERSWSREGINGGWVYVIHSLWQKKVRVTGFGNFVRGCHSRLH